MTAQHDAKRRAILEAAAEVFMRHGFDAGTTKEVAAEVGLSQPAIYHYVGSKTDLLREIALEVDRDMMAALENGLRSSDKPADQLRGVIREYTASVVRDLRAFAVFWQEIRSLQPEIREKIRNDEREFVARVARRGAHDGRTRQPVTNDGDQRSRFGRPVHFARFAVEQLRAEQRLHLAHLERLEAGSGAELVAEVQEILRRQRLHYLPLLRHQPKGLDDPPQVVHRARNPRLRHVVAVKDVARRAQLADNELEP